MFQRRRKTSVWVAFILLVAALGACVPRDKGQQETETPEDTCLVSEYGICLDSLEVNHFTIQKGELLSTILVNLGFTGKESEEITQVVSPFLPLSKLQIGNKYATITTRDSLATIQYLVFEKSRTAYAVVDLSSSDIVAYEDTKPVTLRREYTEGVITSSMWNAIVDSGASALLALALSDLYAWQIDFFDIKKGDSFRLMYDVAYIDDTTMVEISSIEGAVFTHRGEMFPAIPFEQDSTREYFDVSGNSLRKEFLKAPLDFFRISSRFSNSRYHPVLKRYRPHHGVDYAAPRGTPVKTIGDGLVIEKGYQSGGAGNYLKIRHNSTYTTTYMHLSRFASGIGRGSSVKQGEVIGYVGSSGLSTGPHLDFRVHKHNRPVNPLTIESPPSRPVKQELMDSFRVVQQRVMLQLDSLQSAQQVLALKGDSLILASSRS